MKLTKKQEKEIWQVYDTWLNSYLNADVETYNSFLDDDYHFIGSATKEEFLNREDTTKFFAETGDQFAGKTEIRNESKIIEQFGDLIFITHVLDAWFLHKKEWNFYSRFRFSSILRKNKEGWRFIYQHFSIPDPKTAEGETIGYDKINEENQELREAIQRRTIELEQKNRELKIEGALERIRAQAVAMKTSSDLLDIVVTMRNEFIKLGHEAQYFWHMMWGPETYEKAMTSGDGTRIGFVMKLPRHIHGNIPLLANWEKSNQPTVVYPMHTEEAIAYVDKMVALGDFQNIDPQAPSDDDIRHIGGLTFIMARTTHGEIGYSLPGVVENPPKEDLTILIKFAGAFDLAHQRFLDLQKAEAQARETQIELALEKIRSRSMAMHKSDELKEIIQVVYNQLVQLQVKVEHAGFIIDYKEHEDMHIWLADRNSVFPKIVLPYFDCAHWNNFIEAKKTGQNFFTNQLGFEEKNKFYNDLFQFIPDLPDDTKATYFGFEGLAISTVLLDNVGLYIENYQGVPFSDEENAILMRVGKVFQQAYTRFLDLQKSENQAREAQIEAALEKVRSRTMAMQKSEELPLAANNLFLQVQELGIPAWSAGYCIWKDEKQNASCNMSSEGEIQKGFILPSIGEGYDFYTPQENGELFHVKELGDEALVKHYEFMKQLPNMGEILNELINAGLELPTFQIFHIVYFKFGYVMFITYEEVPEAHDIFKRFGQVFEQTYTRFLDLERAEAQAREAQIEAALEKVRSRSLAMHTPNELGDVVTIIVEKLKDLDVVLDANGVVLCTYFTDSKDVLHWIAAPDFSFAGSYLLPYFDHPIFNDAWQSKANGESYFSKAYSIEEKNRFWNYAFEHSDYRHFPDDFKEWVFQNDQHILSFAWQKNSAILIPSHTGVVPTAEDVNILKRFAKVFEQSYTRFLDLQKAEEQAKEAQIEAALERIRSRSMGMQKSEDLAEVVRQTKKEIMELGIQVDNTQIATDFTRDPHDGLNDWISAEGQGYLKKFHIPFFDHPVTTQFYETLESDLDYFTVKYSKSEKNAYFKLLFEHSDFKYTPDERKNFILNKPGWVICGVISINSSMQFARYSLEEYSLEEIGVFKRFAKVFEQAYTRFLDLQKAEVQAREAQIEAALEKVRSRTMAMQKSDELAETSVVVFKELLKLGIEPNRLFIGIVKDNAEAIDAWATNEDGSKIEQHFTLYTSKNKSIKKMVEGWEQQKKSVIIDMKGKELAAYFHYLNKVMHIPFIDGLKQKRRVQSIAYFSGGLIGMASPQEQPQDTINLLERFAAVFNLTYTRFKDLKIAEAQARQAEVDLINLQKAKKNAEEALAELQTTQKQLIQQEKLASLGQLTAGIAHEIKNPLNFVNNFSEVSIELIEEALDEIGQIKNNLHAIESAEILADVKTNLSKIHDHGYRADSIVKSMLMHSRGGSGKMKPTNLNALIKEYVNLSFHGMRAGKNPISVAIDLQLDDQINKIPLVEEDFSRVFLNLCNNAFDAMRERQNANEQLPNSIEYLPNLTVRTMSKNGKISIEIEDNGPGIPDDIIDKILQPFFTTKKGTEGTGLGLSITDDIIKAHGGRLSIPHSDQKGTTFRIDLLKKENL